MKIGKISIENIRIIDHLEIDLIDPHTNAPYPVLLLVGENGVGKSTILQSIVSCLTANRSIYGGDLLGSTDVSKGQSEASILLDVLLNTAEATQYSYDIYNIKVRRSLEQYIYRIINGIPIIVKTPKQWFDRMPYVGGNALFFDAYRIMPSRKVAGPNNRIPDHAIRNSLMSSFSFLRSSNLERFQDTKQWIVNLDYKEAKLYREKQADSGLMNQVVEAFNLLFAPYTFSRVSDKSDILFSTPKGEVDINVLSDGMKSIFAILGDMLFRFSLPYMDEDTIDVNAVLNTEAIVLIDEIDCHLHPKWQLNIIPSLRKLFPNVQFIITTHSPLVVKSVDPHEVYRIGEIAE
jgi:predicted ATP-binding protein involved in virulence